MNYEVTINNFEGPLDLLLHLIKESNMDIFSISIEEITKQYLDFIQKMEEMNLDIASEYLVMAAELMEMKSRTLLPIEEKGEEEEVDPKEALIQRLLEYQKYKEVTKAFKELEEIRMEVYTKPKENERNYAQEKELDLGGITLDDLMAAFQKFLLRKEAEKPLNTKIATKEYSVSVRSNEIKSLLKMKKKISFQELFDVYRKDYIVVTFLSILDLAKKQELKIVQEHNFENIYLLEKGSDV